MSRKCIINNKIQSLVNNIVELKLQYKINLNIENILYTIMNNSSILFFMFSVKLQFKKNVFCY